MPSEHACAYQRLRGNLLRWRRVKPDSAEVVPAEPVTVGALRAALDEAAETALGDPDWPPTAATPYGTEDGNPLPDARLYVTVKPNPNEAAWHPQVVAAREEGETSTLYGTKVHDRETAFRVMRAWWRVIFEDFTPDNDPLPARESAPA